MPRWLTQVRLRLRSVFHGERVEQELREEMRYHLERLIEEGLVSVSLWTRPASLLGGEWGRSHKAWRAAATYCHRCMFTARRHGSSEGSRQWLSAHRHVFDTISDVLLYPSSTPTPRENWIREGDEGSSRGLAVGAWRRSPAGFSCVLATPRFSRSTVSHNHSGRPRRHRGCRHSPDWRWMVALRRRFLDAGFGRPASGRMVGKGDVRGPGCLADTLRFGLAARSDRRGL